MSGASPLPTPNVFPDTRFPGSRVGVEGGGSGLSGYGGRGCCEGGGLMGIERGEVDGGAGWVLGE